MSCVVTVPSMLCKHSQDRWLSKVPGSGQVVSSNSLKFPVHLLQVSFSHEKGSQPPHTPPWFYAWVCLLWQPFKRSAAQLWIRFWLCSGSFSANCDFGNFPFGSTSSTQLDISIMTNTPGENQSSIPYHQLPLSLHQAVPYYCCNWMVLNFNWPLSL